MLESRVRVPQVRGLERERLRALLAGVQRHRVTNVIAPAGSGKTTALAHFAQEAQRSSEVAVAWYSLDTSDGGHLTLLDELQQSVAVATGAPIAPGARWGSALEAVASFEALGRPLIIVIDDAHLINPGSACDVLSELLRLLPDHVSILLGARVPTAIELTRLRVEGLVLDLDADDLRFRTWEAERLLTETFGLLLKPDDVARLTRQVGGWAAGFQLYRLAAQDMPPHRQRELARTTSTRSMLAQRYLAQNLLNALHPRERNFLLNTSVLGIVSATMSDDLLDRTDSAEVLEALESSGGFVSRVEHHTYRYHEVLQSHLEAELAETLSPNDLRAYYARAAELLEAAGHTSESARCYVRAGQRAGIERLLEHLQSPGQLHASAGFASAVIGDQELSSDPWVMLLRARADVVAGKFGQALERYREAETRFATLPTAETCRRERAELAGFIDVDERPPASWIGTFRTGLQRHPRQAATELATNDTPESGIAAALLLFLGGYFDDSGRAFESALLLDDPPDWLIDVARLGRQLTRLLKDVGEPDATHALIERLVGRLDTTWVGRLALPLVAAALGTERSDDAASVAERCADDGDGWGAAIGYLFAGISAHGSPDGFGYYTRAAELAAQQQSDVLSAWAEAGIARSEPTTDDAVEAALRSCRRAGLSGLPIDAFITPAGRLARLPTVGASVVPGSDDGQQPANAASVVENPTAVATPAPIVLTTRCFGEFRVADNVSAVTELRPKAKSVLMRLALNSGRPVSVDTLIDDIWGERSQRRSHRGLQVAVSSIRGALVADSADRTVELSEAGYLLTEPHGGLCDIVEFRNLATMAATDAASAPSAIVEIASRALELATGQLFAEAGLAEWAVAARDEVGVTAARLARRAAAASVELSDPRRAIEFAERGLEFDTFDDAMWRTLIDAHEQCDDVVSAARLRQQYRDLIESLETSTRH